MRHDFGRSCSDNLSIEFPQDIVLRTYLIRSNEFKRRIAISGISAQVRNLYRSKPMPKWLWVCELGRADEILTDDPTDRRIRGEVLLDGNSAPATSDFIAIHLAGGGVGFLALMRPEDKDAVEALARGKFVEPDLPYSALIHGVS